MEQPAGRLVRQTRSQATKARRSTAHEDRRQLTRDGELVQELRYGLRLLRRNPAFAVRAILVLALGRGATVGVFSVVDSLLVRPLPTAAPIAW